jgi:hypothetical protein
MLILYYIVQYNLKWEIISMLIAMLASASN